MQVIKRGGGEREGGGRGREQVVDNNGIIN